MKESLDIRVRSRGSDRGQSSFCSPGEETQTETATGSPRWAGPTARERLETGGGRQNSPHSGYHFVSNCGQREFLGNRHANNSVPTLPLTAASLGSSPRPSAWVCSPGDGGSPTRPAGGPESHASRPAASWRPGLLTGTSPVPPRTSPPRIGMGGAAFFFLDARPACPTGAGTSRCLCLRFFPKPRETKIKSPSKKIHTQFI